MKRQSRFSLLMIIMLTACQDMPDNTGSVVLSPEQQRQEMQEWFSSARFGMFLHWGVYSVLGKGEWVMNNDAMTIEAYEQLPAQFNPEQFDPVEWVSLAKEAGMRYITITSKHHDGFAMWDSAVSDYDIVDRTPYGKDVLKMLADECERQGIKLFFYHSHLDWHHNDYFPRGKTGHHSARPDSGNFDVYLDYMNTQIRELASGKYGRLAGFWFDGWWDQHVDEQDKSNVATHVDWKLQETYDLIHQLQPQALIGNNHHVTPFPGEDFQIVERDLPGQNTFGYNTIQVSGLPLETCDTMNRSWGYDKNDSNWKSTKEIVHYLARAAGAGANLLLNVGPTPEGTFQPEVIERLKEVGKWTRMHGETIYGTTGGPMPSQPWGISTRKNNLVYIHILDGEAPETLTLPQTTNLSVKRAYRFGSNESVPFKMEDEIILELPKASRDSIDTIVVLEL